MIDGVAPSYNIVVEILIYISGLSILPFYKNEACLNSFILLGALFSMNIYMQRINL